MVNPGWMRPYATRIEYVLRASELSLTAHAYVRIIQLLQILMSFDEILDLKAVRCFVFFVANIPGTSNVSINTAAVPVLFACSPDARYTTNTAPLGHLLVFDV